ncbi:MAG: DUF370 domain-containing protein [Clostridia bacterium]|nr:DUF370 domain-containing protein [Clostridia bacterium]
MYLHIGNDLAVAFNDIIAILNLETSSKAATTKDFLKKSNSVANPNFQENDYKSCVVTDRTVYYSTISSGTLFKRATALLK